MIILEERVPLGMREGEVYSGAAATYLGLAGNLLSVKHTPKAPPAHNARCGPADKLQALRGACRATLITPSALMAPLARARTAPVRGRSGVTPWRGSRAIGFQTRTRDSDSASLPCKI